MSKRPTWRVAGLVLGLALLTLSAIFAPKVRTERGLAAREGGLIDEDPQKRVELGEREDLLGVTLSGYNAILDETPDDEDAIRGRVLMRLSSDPSATPDLDPKTRGVLWDP